MTNRKPKGTFTKPLFVSKLRNAIEAGQTLAQIAERFGISPAMAARLTVPYRNVRKRVRMTPKTIAAIMTEYKDGAVVSALATKYSVSKLSVYRYTHGTERARQPREHNRRQDTCYKADCSGVKAKAMQLLDA